MDKRYGMESLYEGGTPLTGIQQAVNNDQKNKYEGLANMKFAEGEAAKEAQIAGIIAQREQEAMLRNTQLNIAKMLQTGGRAYGEVANMPERGLSEELVGEVPGMPAVGPDGRPVYDLKTGY